MERRLVCQGYFATTYCGGIGFDPGRGEQSVYFSQCRLLLEAVDLCQICQMHCFWKEGGPIDEQIGSIQQPAGQSIFYITITNKAPFLCYQRFA
jgi:hypothetical protein